MRIGIIAFVVLALIGCQKEKPQTISDSVEENSTNQLDEVSVPETITVEGDELISLFKEYNAEKQRVDSVTLYTPVNELIQTDKDIAEFQTMMQTELGLEFPQIQRIWLDLIKKNRVGEWQQIMDKISYE